MKKLLAILMTLAMLAGLCATVVFADDTYTITISKETAGHIYEAYQIFVGKVSTDADGVNILTDISWGTGVTSAGKSAMGNAEDVAATLTDEAASKAFAEEVAAYLSNTSAASTYDADAKNYKIDDLAGGYYLIKDRDNTLDTTNEGYTSYILKVVADTTATPKDGSTTSIKKVDDKNDSNTSEDEIAWDDSADHDIGDMIDFKLEVTIADDYASYDSYYLAFHDIEEQSLTFDPDSVKVYIDGDLVTAGYEVVTDTDDGHTFDVVFADLKTVTGATAKAGSTVTVRYQSQLNDNAVLGSQGNVNKMYAEFSNNPNDEQNGRGKTEEDKVIIFTYKTVINKVDENLNALAGAEFTLEKFIADSEGTEEYNGVTGNWSTLETVEAQPETTFTFYGIDDGEYRLTETKAPEHYNSLDEPIYFTVSADHDLLWETQARTDVLNTLTGDVVSGEAEFTADLNTGSVSGDVVNEKGLVLPETGGMGTTVFYICGAVLVLGAVVVLITKKRMNAEK